VRARYHGLVEFPSLLSPLVYSTPVLSVADRPIVSRSMPTGVPTLSSATGQCSAPFKRGGLGTESERNGSIDDMSVARARARASAGIAVSNRRGRIQ